jgi:glycosyltransferase involved in cell wall biosynthesis
VVIPTWNRAELIRRAVDSVLAQTFADFEIIVVDDGSDDGTPAELKRITDPRVRLLRLDHEGVSAARNAGVRAATGAYVAFLDSDDEAYPPWLERLAEGLRRSAADVAVSGAVTIDPDGAESSWVPAGHETGPDDVAPRFEAGCCAVRRDLFLVIGGFDPALRFGENTELALRLLTSRPIPLVAAVPHALVRIRRRARTHSDAERSARVESARVVVARYRRHWRDFPRLWASYHAIVGVGCAQDAYLREALYHFAWAFRSDPTRPEHLRRLAAGAVPVVARRTWSDPARRGRLDPGGDRTPRAHPAVLFIVLAPGVGGSVRSLGTVLAHLPGTRRILGRPRDSSTSAFFAERGLADVEVDLPRPVGGRMIDRPRAALALAVTAWRHRQDLTAVHANGLSELNLAIVPALIARCPVVVWVHEWEVSPWSRRLGPLLRVTAPDLRFAAVSAQTVDMLVTSQLARPAQVTVVPNPIDPRDVCAPRPHRRGPRLRVAYVGTPAPYKGFQLLPELIRATGDALVEWVIFAGPQTMMPATFAELYDLGAELPGKTHDVGAVYGSCDAVVVPSRRESFGRVVAEAMANGLPVVASDLSPLRDLLGDDQAGLLVPPDDVAALASAVARLAGDPELCATLGKEGRLRSERFAPGPIAGQLEALYASGR